MGSRTVCTRGMRITAKVLRDTVYDAVYVVAEHKVISLFYISPTREEKTQYPGHTG